MHKVAVIEDERAIAEMYRMKLKKHGFDVRLAHDGEQGLALLEEFRPDLALLDLRMPVMTGDKMLEHVRQQPWGGNIRIIVLTNISKDEAPSGLRFLSVDRYIVKAHHTPTEIVEAVHNLLGTDKA